MTQPDQHQQQTPQTTDTDPMGLEAIALPSRGRALFLGITGSGKSEVKLHLVQHWIATHKNPRVLILDSKPRFRTEKFLNGLPASRLYKKWRRGPVLPGSYLLPLQNPAAELKQVWRLGGRIAVAQITDQQLMPLLRNAANAFYATADDKYDQLVDVDELADFYGTTGYAKHGDPLLKIARSGREMNVALAAAAQRPKGLPKSFITEMSSLYMFALPSQDDVQHLEDMGVPGDTPLPSMDHSFLYFDRYHREKTGLYRLRLPQ